MLSGSDGTLKISGYLRGIPLSVNNLVHIPGLGTYQMSQIDAPPDPYTFDKKRYAFRISFFIYFCILYIITLIELTLVWMTLMIKKG